MPSNTKYFFSILKGKLLLLLLQFGKQQPQQHIKNNISGEMFPKKTAERYLLPENTCALSKHCRFIVVVHLKLLKKQLVFIF
jgi:hypothetical protein